MTTVNDSDLLASVLRKILHANDNGYVGYVHYYPLRLTLDLTIDITDEALEAIIRAAPAG